MFGSFVEMEKENEVEQNCKTRESPEKDKIAEAVKSDIFSNKCSTFNIIIVVLYVDQNCLTVCPLN